MQDTSCASPWNTNVTARPSTYGNSSPASSRSTGPRPLGHRRLESFDDGHAPSVTAPRSSRQRTQRAAARPPRQPPSRLVEQAADRRREAARQELHADPVVGLQARARVRQRDEARQPAEAGLHDLGVESCPAAGCRGTTRSARSGPSPLQTMRPSGGRPTARRRRTAAADGAAPRCGRPRPAGTPRRRVAPRSRRARPAPPGARKAGTRCSNSSWISRLAPCADGLIDPPTPRVCCSASTHGSSLGPRSARRRPHQPLEPQPVELLRAAASRAGRASRQAGSGRPRRSVRRAPRPRFSTGRPTCSRLVLGLALLPARGDQRDRASPSTRSSIAAFRLGAWRRAQHDRVRQLHVSMPYPRANTLEEPRDARAGGYSQCGGLVSCGSSPPSARFCKLGEHLHSGLERVQPAAAHAFSLSASTVRSSWAIFDSSSTRSLAMPPVGREPGEVAVAEGIPPLPERNSGVISAL